MALSLHEHDAQQAADRGLPRAAALQPPSRTGCPIEARSVATTGFCVTCDLQGLPMALVGDPAGQGVHWRATAWTLVICSDDDGEVVSLQEVVVERA